MSELEKQKLEEITEAAKELNPSDMDYIKGFIDGRASAKENREEE